MPKDSRPSRQEVLFEPVRIGPKNRFFQVPHCNDGGSRDPSAVAEMRRGKAEGGGGVIFTEQPEIHQCPRSRPSSSSACGMTATSRRWRGWPRR